MCVTKGHSALEQSASIEEKAVQPGQIEIKRLDRDGESNDQRHGVHRQILASYTSFQCNKAKEKSKGKKKK